MVKSFIKIGLAIFAFLGRKAPESFISYIQEYIFFKTVIQKYLSNIHEDFGRVHVLGMKERVSLDSLYVRLNMLENLSIVSSVMPEEMERNRAILLSNFGTVVETFNGEEVLNCDDNLIILGKPGAGKTTCLKYLMLRMASKDTASKIKQRRLPFFVTLHEFAKSNNSLLDYLSEQLNRCGFENAQLFIKRKLLHGDCLILLDGLDEVSRDTQLGKVIQEVVDFTRKYRGSRFVLSCRTATYNRWFDDLNFRIVEIADFNKDQIKDFVQKYFKKEPERSEDCWQKLRENSRLLEMATSPLLLTLLSISYDTNQKDFASNRYLLYYHAIKNLIKTWDESRRIKRDKLYKDLGDSHLLKLLSRLAAGYFENDIYFVREEDLQEGIGKILVDLMNDSKMLSKGGVVLQDIEEHYGLIVRRSQYAFSFSHLTLMEYFTAQNIVGKGVEVTVVELGKHLGDDRWLEVFLLALEKLNHNADYFILMMQKKNRQILEEISELNELLKEIQTSLLPNENYSMIEREWASFYLFFAPNSDFDYTIDSDFDYAIDSDFDYVFDSVLNITIDLGRTLSLARTFNCALDFEYLENYSMTINLDLKVVQKIEEYLKGNVWLARAISSNNTISTRVHKKILVDMFQPL